MAHVTNTSESALRGLVLVIALVAVWSTASWAGNIGVPLTDGTLTLRMGPVVGFVDERLISTGPDFSIDAVSGFRFLPPSCGTCIPGSSFTASTSTGGGLGVNGSVTYGGVMQAI